MANHETETDVWVEGRIAALMVIDSEWRPDETGALAAVRSRYEQRRARVKRWWIGVPLATSVAGLVLFVVPVSRACAQSPTTCAQRVWTAILAGRALQADFKKVGSPAAPVAFEIYLDYECPPCAAFVNDVLPRLEAEYVQTGRLRLIFRDLPLPMHRNAGLAARYANAAGQLGYYGVASRQIFRTQSIWSSTGDIEAQLAIVLPVEVMNRVRSLAANGGMLAEDQAAAQQDHINRTPSVIVVSDGRREPVPSDNSFAAIKTYLDALLVR